MTVIAALRHDRIDAPFVMAGPVNGSAFQAHVEKVLARTLRPGDVVVMDNPGSHKGLVVHLGEPLPDPIFSTDTAEDMLEG